MADDVLILQSTTTTNYYDAVLFCAPIGLGNCCWEFSRLRCRMHADPDDKVGLSGLTIEVVLVIHRHTDKTIESTLCSSEAFAIFHAKK